MKPEKEFNTRALDHNTVILNDASGQGRPLNHHRVPAIAASSAAKMRFDQGFDPAMLA